VLHAGSFPVLEGALEAARHGLRTGGDARNRDFTAGRISLDGVPPELELLGYDPQTSGGLLVSLPAAFGAVLEAEFRAGGLDLARVGTVEEGTGVEVV
jgi:selenide,water dikinase